jgi:hypothetical protein
MAALESFASHPALSSLDRERERITAVMLEHGFVPASLSLSGDEARGRLS